MVLYYRMPDLSGKRKTISAIPLNLPLTVASHVAECGAPKPTEIVHSEVQGYSHKNDNGGEDFLWCLAKLGPDGEPEKLASGVYRLGSVPKTFPVSLTILGTLGLWICDRCWSTTPPR